VLVGCPEHVASLTEITLLLNFVKPFMNLCSSHIYSVKATLNISNIPVAFFPSLKENLLQRYCFKSAIFCVHENHKWNNALWCVSYSVH
jgi:hypothetical protein